MRDSMCIDYIRRRGRLRGSFGGIVACDHAFAGLKLDDLLWSHRRDG
jgi:hypothetical protein